MVKKIIMTVLIVCLFAGCAAQKGGDLSRREKGRYLRDKKLAKETTFDIPVVINDDVIKWLDYFQNDGRDIFGRYLKRSGKYEKFIRETLAQYGVAKDMIFSALIESGFSTHAYSRAHAVGIWQFIKSTGKMYGLRIDNEVDERRDPIKSTHAAARFLKDLYGDYKDWWLVLAAYNAGPGTVNRGVRTSGAKCFWKISDHKHLFKKETKDHIPKIIAAAIIGKHPKKFGFNIDYDEPLEYDTVEVETQTDLYVIADLLGKNSQEIIDLNPWLIRGATPTGERNYQVRVPRGEGDRFRVAYASLPETERIRFVVHRVKKGQSIHQIANMYGVDVDELKRWNGIRSNKNLRGGVSLRIYKGKWRPEKDDARYASLDEGSGGDDSKIKSFHILKKNENLSRVAAKYGVGMRDLMKWNNISNPKLVKAGRKLVVYSKASKNRKDIADLSSVKPANAYHVVKHGETLIGIAERYGMTVGQIKDVNELKEDMVVIGMKLKVVGRPGTVASREVVDDAYSKDEDVRGYQYTLKDGETLGGVANRHGVSVKELMVWNKITNVKSIRAGQKLLIKKNKDVQPNRTAGAGDEQRVRSISTSDASVDFAKEKDESRSAKVASDEVKGYRYKLLSGETLGGVANRHGVTVKELIQWNKIKNVKSIRAGDELLIKKDKDVKPEVIVQREDAQGLKTEVVSNSPATEVQSVQILPVANQNEVVQSRPIESAGGEEIVYFVKKGESLWNIAKKNNVTIAELVRLNNIVDPRSVKPGDKLRIVKK